MANEEHVAKLRKGINVWNQWRRDNPELEPDLVEADLGGADLGGADLGGADLSGANICVADLSGANLNGATLKEANICATDLNGADLSGADLRWAELSGAVLNEANLGAADLRWANLSGADLRRANLKRADLSGVNLNEANLSGADLSEANIRRASLVQTMLDDARLNGCRAYGTSVWDVSLKGTSQQDLIITEEDEDAVTVDNLKLAQFIHLLLKNEEVRHIIDTITSKVVLILGRFTDERKKVLDALRNELRTRDYTPILFDFEKPASRDLTETISTLAHMAKFVIADITDAKSIPQELQKIVPNLPSLPVRPIILENQYEHAMFKDFGGYLSVLPPYRYQDTDHLLETMEEQVIGPALNKAKEIEERRRAFEQELANR